MTQKVQSPPLSASGHTVGPNLIAADTWLIPFNVGAVGGVAQLDVGQNNTQVDLGWQVFTDAACTQPLSGHSMSGSSVSVGVKVNTDQAHADKQQQQYGYSYPVVSPSSTLYLLVTATDNVSLFADYRVPQPLHVKGT